MTKKPNIVFFFTDDQRFDTIKALGNEEIHTPNLDQLVNEGLSFTQAHIPGAMYAAVCMPSRAMLHSGRNLFQIEADGRNIPQEHTTLGEALRKAGYRTFGTGKWHNGTSAYARSFTDGGEIFFGGMGDHWNVPACDFDPSGEYKSQPFIKDPSTSNELSYRKCDHIQAGKHSTELFADISIDFINKHKSPNPFFMYISFMAPHDPRTMPEKFLNMYEPEKIKLPASFKPQHDFDFGVSGIRDEKLAPYPRTEEDTKKQIAEYYAMISHLDNEIGRVIQTLKDKGEYENTLIIIAGDNGLAVGKHGLFGKQNLYEHSVRVPLILAGPGIPRKKKSEAFVYLHDIYPTVCDLLGIDIPNSVNGKSFLPAVKDQSKPHREKLYFAYTDIVRAVKNHEYKLIEYLGKENNPCRKTQLFNLQEDPEEINNLADKSEYNGIIDELRKEMERFSKDWDEKQHPLGEKCRQRLDFS